MKIKAIVIVFVLLTVLVAGCAPVLPSQAPVSAPASTPQSTPTPTPTPTSKPTLHKTHIYTRGAIEVGGNGEPIELINNPNRATNPTYAEVLDFIKKDRTDEYSYIFGPPKVAYVCSDFARDVHNNAEVAGIRAAWVGIDIQGKTEGHAVTAFETSDIGMVFIDCTGRGLWSEPTGQRTNWDRRARVEIGKEYAVTDLDNAYKGKITCVISIEDYMRETDSIAPQPEYKTRMLKIYDWIKTNDINSIGQKWMQEWLTEHKAELNQCRVSEPAISGGIGRGSHTFFNTYVQYSSEVIWTADVDCVVIPELTSKSQVVDIDGIPVRWAISGFFSPGITPLGIVKDIHIHW